MRVGIWHETFWFVVVVVVVALFAGILVVDIVVVVVVVVVDFGLLLGVEIGADAGVGA